MGPLQIPPFDLGVDVDQPPGVDRVVGRVDDAHFVEGVAVSLLLELVVGRAGDDVHLEHLQRVVVDDRAEGTGGEDVRLGRVHVLGRNRLRAELLDHPVDFVVVDVAHDQLRAVVMEVFAEVVPHVAAPLDRDDFPAQRIAPVRLLGAGLDPTIDTEGRHG